MMIDRSLVEVEMRQFSDNLYISSIMGFHSLTRALMNQLDIWLLLRPVLTASLSFSLSLGYLLHELSGLPHWRYHQPRRFK
jgi:hypothetical protein